MRTDTKAKIILWSIAIVMISITALILVMLINEAFGETTPYGEPYLASYSYCDQTIYGVKGQSWCGHYATGHEWRQHTHIKGLWFDGESSRLVDKR